MLNRDEPVSGYPATAMLEVNLLREHTSWTTGELHNGTIIVVIQKDGPQFPILLHAKQVAVQKERPGLFLELWPSYRKFRGTSRDVGAYSPTSYPYRKMLKQESSAL